MALLSLVNFQTALFDRLKSVSALASIVGNRIHGHVPQNEIFPYVHCFMPNIEARDTKDTIGENILIQIDTWSELHDDVEVLAMLDVVFNALHNQPLIFSSGTSCLLQRTVRQVFVENDGQSHHGVLQFRSFVSAENSTNGVPTP